MTNTICIGDMHANIGNYVCANTHGKLITLVVFDTEIVYVFIIPTQDPLLLFSSFREYNWWLYVYRHTFLQIPNFLSVNSEMIKNKH